MKPWRSRNFNVLSACPTGAMAFRFYFIQLPGYILNFKTEKILSPGELGTKTGKLEFVIAEHSNWARVLKCLPAGT